MSLQDSQSELRAAIEAYKRYPYGTKEFPHITSIELLEVINVYVTTQVKEAERLARIDELNRYKKSVMISSDISDHTVGMNIVNNRIKALTTTTNGKGE